MTTYPITQEWHDMNQRYLAAALRRVRALLETQIERVRGTGAELPTVPTMPDYDSVAPPTLATLYAAFGLSAFERDTLLLCAGVELDSTFAALCATAQDDSRRPYPTFSLALAALPDAHWSALTPAAPLRRWRLIEVISTSNDPLTSSPIRIDERILHYLTGVSYLDDRLNSMIRPLSAPRDLPPSQQSIAERIAALWSRAENAPLIQLSAGRRSDKVAVASTASSLLGARLHLLQAGDVPAGASEQEALARLWEREAALGGSILLIDCDETDGERLRPALGFIERVQGIVCIANRDPLPSLAHWRPVVRIDVNPATSAEQGIIWHSALSHLSVKLNGQIERLRGQFDLDAPAIYAAAAGISDTDESTLSDQLWDASRIQSRPRLDNLAQRIAPNATWDDLVLPDLQRQILRDMAAHLRQRMTVYEDWGFAAKSSRGLGISALFAGPSGTGKTMAAEVLANELRLDLYRIDLSAVVSKYIGETEKNLRALFDAAEYGGVILFFDEADALFGKRSEVKDSHDRYANIEVSYLLQRMEAYRGLAILTTNMKGALDTAFMRRIRFVVQFPFPNAAQRAEIWRKIFPSQTPTHNLDADKLARLNIAGGSIRNIALNAAFLAADAGEPVQMPHLLRAARTEYTKLEKPLTEIGDW